MSSILKGIELAPVMRIDPRHGAVVDRDKRLYGGERGHYIEPDANGIDLVVIDMLARLRLNESLFGTLEDGVVAARLNPEKVSASLGRDLDERLSDAASRIGLDQAVGEFSDLLGRKHMVQFIAGVVIQKFAPKTLIGTASMLEREQMLSHQIYIPNESLSFKDRGVANATGQLLGKYSSRLRQAPGSELGSF